MIGYVPRRYKPDTRPRRAESMLTSRLTYQDYGDLESDKRYELLDGRLVAVPARKHGPPDRQYQADDPGVSLRGAEMVSVGSITPHSTSCSQTSTSSNPTSSSLPKTGNTSSRPTTYGGAPDLTVKKLSPSTSWMGWRDKRDLYAKHGVLEYWIIDPTNRIVSVMQLRDGVLEIEQTCAKGDSATSMVLDGFSASLDEIFS